MGFTSICVRKVLLATKLSCHDDYDDDDSRSLMMVEDDNPHYQIMVVLLRKMMMVMMMLMILMMMMVMIMVTTICILLKGGAPDYQLVYFFWEKGKVLIQTKKRESLCKKCKKLKQPLSSLIRLENLFEVV